MMRLCLLLFAALLVLSGCDLSMERQRKYTTFAPSQLWPDGKAARAPPEHVVAQGDRARRDAMAQPAHATAPMLARGRQRYDIFCAPCHGADGQRDGMVVRRGFPAPPSYHVERLRSAPAAHFFDVITHGYGVMYSYATRVPPEDRWAIIAYIRALQLSRATRIADVPEAREKLP